MACNLSEPKVQERVQPLPLSGDVANTKNHNDKKSSFVLISDAMKGNWFAGAETPFARGSPKTDNTTGTVHLLHRGSYACMLAGIYVLQHNVDIQVFVRFLPQNA
jgi:hypothetical protein